MAYFSESKLDDIVILILPRHDDADDSIHEGVVIRRRGLRA